MLVDKPEGPSSFALVASLRGRTGARAGPRGDARPVCERASARAARRLDPAGAVPRRAGQALRDGGRPARAHLDRRPRRRGARAARAAAAAGARAAVAAPRRRGRAAGACGLGGEDRRRAGLQAPPARGRGRDAAAALDGASARACSGTRKASRRLDLRVGSGTYVRAIADSLGGHCRTLRRTEVGPFRVEDADGSGSCRRSRRFPSCRSSRWRGRGAAIRTGRRGTTSRCGSSTAASSWRSTGR